MPLARAAVFTAAGAPHELRELAVPEPQGREVLVRVTACTLCGSDLHTLAGRRQTAVPTILGHEVLGRIERFGGEASRVDWAGQPLREGDRVTWAVAAHCGACFYCRRDLPQKCQRLFKYGHEPLRSGRELSGGLAEFCLLVAGTDLFRVPDGLPDEAACPANCATATAAAVLEAAGPLAGRTVLVLGAGMLGLSAAALARRAGAAEVVCVEVNPARRALAEAFGASRVASPDEAAQVVAAATGGHGADAALELSGASAAVESGLARLRVGGTLVLAGAVFPTPPVPLEPETIVRRCLSLRGVHNYAPRHLQTAIEFLTTAGAYPFASLVEGWFGLAEVERAIAHARAAAALRVGVRP